LLSFFAVGNGVQASSAQTDREEDLDKANKNSEYSNLGIGLKKKKLFMK
jgi:hypothetical protein